MNLHIQNIDLELLLVNQDSYANLEKEVHRRFKQRVLEPLDRSLSNMADNSFLLYKLGDISIEDELRSLTDLDRYFDKLRKKIEQKITQRVRRQIVDSKTISQNKSSKYVTESLLFYIETASFRDNIDLATLQNDKQRIPFSEFVVAILNRKISWSQDNVIRLLDFYSFEEISQYFLFKQASAQATTQRFKKFWFKNAEQEAEELEQIYSSPEKLSVLQNKVQSLTGISLENFQVASILIFLESIGLTVNAYEFKKILPISFVSDIEILHKKSIQEIEKQALPTSKTIKKEGRFVNLESAGLLLLHPFLLQLFKEQGLYKNGDIVDCPRALALLYYLSTGHDVVPKNYELYTEKILLGLQLEDSFLITNEIDEDEKEACNNLLTAVIDHWGVLGNTTPVGLRELFIRREARAIQKDKNWTIEIERKAQDILLDKLPWGLRPIKFPWAEGIINVKYSKS